MSGRAIHVGDSGEPKYVLKAEMRELRRRVGVLEDQARALAQVVILLARGLEESAGQAPVVSDGAAPGASDAPPYSLGVPPPDVPPEAIHEVPTDAPPEALPDDGGVSEARRTARLAREIVAGTGLLSASVEDG